jgi:ribokinase
VITVVGSLNLDLFIEAPRLPAPGETVLGGGLRREPGGKGANQACAVARMKQPVSLIGAVGRDVFGDELLRHLGHENVDLQFVARREQEPTGLAFIVVDPSGQNQIVVAAGANATLTAADVALGAPRLRESRAVLVQLEIPLDAVGAALRMGRESGALTVLNPAPFSNLPEEWFRLCDWIVPNEVEAAQLSGPPVGGPSEAAAAAGVLHRRSGGAGIVVTLGAAGAWVESKSFSGHVPAFSVEAVDAVAAGDAFIGAFVTRLLEGEGPREAAHFGCAAAAVSVTRRGAQASLPHRDEVAPMRDHALGLTGASPQREPAQRGA